MEFRKGGDNMQSRKKGNSIGIDISHYQTISDWQTVKDSGISFAFLKATEGSYSTDNTFQSHLEGAKSVGIYIGAYHFCRATNPESAVKEADFFIETINNAGGFSILDLPPTLDIETNEGANGDNISAICRAWINRVKEAAGKQPILYTYPSFADQYLDKSLGDIPLWLANYNSEINDHAGWTEWLFLQYEDSGSVPGISGHVDMDEYNGNIEDYVKQINGTQEDDEDMDKVLDYPDWAWQELNTYIGNAYNDSIIDTWDWVQKVRDKTLTYKDLLLLKILIDERRRTK